MSDVQRTLNGPATATGWSAAGYGGPEAMVHGEHPVAQAADGRATVRVVAASVNPLDWHTLRGEPWLMRLSSGLRRPKQTALGSDLAGVVEAIGDGVDDLRPGNQVFGSGIGAWGDVANVRATSLAIKPDSLSHDEAAALPVAGVTALQALRDHATLSRGDQVLVIGAAGGVGTFAVQIAKAMGATVTAVCSTANVDLVRSLGADRVIDYTVTDPTAQDDRYDAIVDMVGAAPLRACKRMLQTGGRYVVVGGPAGSKLLGPVSRMVRAKLAFLGSRKVCAPMMAKLNRADLQELAAMTERGQLRAVIDRRLPMGQAPEAVTYLETGRARGKVVLLADSCSCTGTERTGTERT